MSWRRGPGVSVFADHVFAGKVAVITGGGTGLGREVALSFAALGASVVIAGRTQSNLDDVVATVTENGGSCLAVPTNIREADQVEGLRDITYATYGQVDFLINNAGGQFPSLPSEVSDNGWRAVVDLNLNGTWNMTNRFMQPMAEAGFGSIVNVVHTFSFDRGAPMFVHSGAARAGVVSMVKTLAPYLMRHGVTINAFAPGAFATPGMIAGELETVGFPKRASPRSWSVWAPPFAWARSTRWPPWFCSSAARRPVTSVAPRSSPTAPPCRATGSTSFPMGRCNRTSHRM